MDIVELLKYILLGLVQGACEILPISSSGHLIIFQNILGMTDINLAFSVFLHFGSLIAVVIFLWKKIWNIFTGTCRYIFKKDKSSKPMFHYFIMLVISTVITAIIGILVEDYVTSWGTLGFVGIALVVNGLWLLVVNYMSKLANQSLNEAPWWKSIIVGLGQAVGVFPGISRSGATLGSAVCSGIKKEDAAEYAFILFIPVELGALILSIKDLSATENSLIIPYIIGFIVAGITTFFALKLFLTIIKNKKISYFSYYCFVVGIACALVYFL